MVKLVLQIILFILPAAVLLDDVFAKFHQKDYKIKYERSVLKWYDKSVYKSFAIKTFKYNRTLAVTNITYELHIDFQYDFLCLIQIYKQYSNEYRHFPIRLQINFCSVIDYDLAGVGKAFLKENSGCPLKKGVVYHMGNFFPDESLLPPLMPTGEFMAEITVFHANKNVSTFSTYATVYRPLLPKD